MVNAKGESDAREIAPNQPDMRGELPNDSPSESQAIVAVVPKDNQEETPPPSRPPSPPPASSDSEPDNESAWSIEIEELHDEPKPAGRQSTERGRSSRKTRRSRSSSWSRSIVNSFRRKKGKTSTSEERFRSRQNPEEIIKGQEADVTAATSRSKQSTDERNSDETSAELTHATKVKSSGILNMGSFRRRKSTPQLTDSTDIKSANPTDTSVLDTTSSVRTTTSEVCSEVQEDKLKVAGTDQNPEMRVESAEPTKQKPSRMLSFGSFRRKKSVPVKPDNESKSTAHKDEEITRETGNPSDGGDIADAKGSDPGAKPKSRMLSFGSFGRRKSLLTSDRSRSLDQPAEEHSKDKSAIKTKSKVNSQKQPKSERRKEEPNLDLATGNTSKVSKPKSKEQTIKQEKSKFNSSKTVSKDEQRDIIKTETTGLDPSETAGADSEMESVTKRKDNSFMNFFRREKKQQQIVEVLSSDSAPTTESTADSIKKGGRLRNSLARRMKTKSVEIESHLSDGNSSTRVPRSGSLFGSSFSLKRVFHSVETTSSSNAELQSQPLGKSPSGILTKRNSSSHNSRPKSVQLDESPQIMEKEPDALEKTFGVRLQSSIKPKKPSRGKSAERVHEPSVSTAETIQKNETAPSLVVTKAVFDAGETAEVPQVPLETEGISAAIETKEKRGYNKAQETVVSGTLPSNPVPVSEPTRSNETPANPSPQAINVQTRPIAGLRSSTDPDRAAIDQSIDEALLKELVKSSSDTQKVPAQLTTIKPAFELPLKETVIEVLAQLRSIGSIEGDQLRKILDNRLFQDFIHTHDTVAAEYLEQKKFFNEHLSLDFSEPFEHYIEWDMPADVNAVRIVGLRRNPGEPLGLTVKAEDGQLVIARILGGGAVDRQGLLHVGDVIGEVNGVPVYTAEQLQVEIARSKEHVQLKILPSAHESVSHGAQCCVRAHFDYDPKEDKLLPCPEIGLAFKKGDILQVVNQSDPNWWQAKKVGWSGPAGLIPSQELEERRKAFVAPEADFVHKIGFCGARISKKKKKLMYQIKSSVELDKAELLLYEEVTRMPPFRRKTLVLIGSEGIGRRTLKNRLINSDPERFGTTLPHTSRPMRELEEDGMGYWFVSREEMEHDIREHQFLEYGEHNGHLYGSKLDSIRTVIRQGKMCVLDCSPNSLKILHNSPEFMPYVIFLAAPGMEQLKSLYEAASSRYSSRNLGGTFERSSSIRFSSRRARTLESLVSLYEEEDFKNALEESARIQRTYEKYFDMVIVNEDPDHTFRKVIESLENLSNQHQWVPVSWVY